MAKFLVQRAGCGKYKQGDIVELTESEVAFYAAKVMKLPTKSEEAKLEVATPAKTDEKPKAK